MPLPGVSDEKELKPLLKRLLDNKDEVFKFAVAARGPKEGTLILSRKEKLKKRDVQTEAEAEAKEQNGGKAVKLDVMTGECCLDARNATTLRLIVSGKAPAKAVACVEHLLTRGPFKSIGFTNVILEEVEETADDAPAVTAPAATAPAATAPASAAPASAAPASAAPASAAPESPAPSSSATAHATPTESQPATLEAQKTKLAEALKQLKPAIDKAIDADPNRKNALFQSMAQIAGQIKQDQLEGAKSSIVALGKLVQGLLASTATPAGATEDSGIQERFEAAKARLEPQLNAARRANPEKGNALLNLWNYALDRGEAANFKTASAALDKLEAAIAKALPETDAAQPAASQEPATALADALRDWQAAREMAIDQLARLSVAFRRSDHPQADDGIVLLQAIIKNLTPRPGTSQQVAELTRYLETDDIIVEAEQPNPFGFTVSIRAPLLKVLAELNKHIS